MVKIIYSSHLQFRLAMREIPYALPKQIFITAKEFYFDTQTRKGVAVGKVRHKHKLREMAVVYEQKDGNMILITIHPLKESQKLHRIKSGRWKKL